MWLLGKLLLDTSWKLVEVTGGVEVWERAGGMIVHIVRATGDVIEMTIRGGVLF